VDLVLKAGGFSPGESLLIRGPSESGKTAFCLHLLAQAARNHGTVVFVDLDDNLELRFAKEMGFFSERWVLVKPHNLNEALEIAFELICSRAVSMIVIDSITPPLEENEGVAHEKRLATLLPTLFRSARRHGSIIVVTQQWQPSTSSAYHNLRKHLARLSPLLLTNYRFDLESCEYIFQEAHVSGLKIKCKAISGKVRQANFPIEINLMYN
jgi:recombination protein RecA